jgi:hypothetical protein
LPFLGFTALTQNNTQLEMRDNESAMPVNHAGNKNPSAMVLSQYVLGVEIGRCHVSIWVANGKD